MLRTLVPDAPGRPGSHARYRGPAKTREPDRIGLRGWLPATDRLNLIRVMPVEEVGPMPNVSSPVSARTVSPAEVAAVLTAVRERHPLVHCMTNIVVAGFTANVLLAVGAAPAMVENDEEAAEFAAIADALLVNLGTLSAEVARAMRLATASAHEHQRPWVLDPVAVGAMRFRTGLAAELLESGPAVVRGNSSEVLSLAGAAGAGRGVDSTVGSEAAVDTARVLALRTGAVVAVSGAVDYLTDGTDLVQVHTGHPLMTQVTGVGCALGALVAACCGTGAPPLLAAVAATTVLTVAAEESAAVSAGPGSFAVGLIDALANLDEQTIQNRVQARADAR
jgi:hydroxyethylthiazole kinase